MSTTSSATSLEHIFVHSLPTQVATSNERAASSAFRRQPSMSQGQALEKLGRAIEYLYDSRVYRNADGVLTPDDVEAVQALMRLSREVFVQCREVSPSRSGLKLWLSKIFSERRAA